MKAVRTGHFRLLACIGLVSAACGAKDTPVFDISGAVAVGRVARSNQALNAVSPQSGALGSSTPSELMKVDSSGTVSSAGPVAPIAEIAAVKVGVLVTLGDGTKYLAKTDGSQVEVPVAAQFVGENLPGDLIFHDGTVYRTQTGAVEKLTTVMEGAGVMQVSGNFAILASYRPSGGGAAVYDTISTKRYNVRVCDGPRVIALSSTVAYVDDCQPNPIIDMETGTRSAMTGVTTLLYSGGIVEALLAADGAYFLSPACPGAGSGAFTLCKLTADGAVAPVLSTVGVQPYGTSVYGNVSLFGWGDYLVVRELNQVDVIQIGVDAKTSILTGYNVAKVSVAGDLVYYLAEDSLGHPVAGLYRLSTGETKTIDGAASFEELVPILP